MDECDALGARRTSRSVHGLSFSLSPPRRNGWLIRQRIRDVASRKPEPDCDGLVGLEGRGAAHRHSNAGRGRDFSREKLGGTLPWAALERFV